MRLLMPALTGLLLVTCVRSPDPRPLPPYDPSIRFPHALRSPGLRLGQSEQRMRVDGAIVQAMMIAAKDFIPSRSERSSCWTKPEDFLFDVIRKGDIIFVSISPDSFAQGCERAAAPLDWGAKYAISADGRILTQEDGYDDGPEWESSPVSSDAGENADGGYSRTYELSDLDRMKEEPVEDPPFFMRPEWLDSENNPRRSLRNTFRTRDGGAPDGGTPDGGALPLPPR